MPQAVKVATVATTPAKDKTPVQIYLVSDHDFVIPVVFPDYKIHVEMLGLSGEVPNLGHAGVLIVNGKTGKTMYGEYGRYQGEEGPPGVVRVRAVPDVTIKAGAITEQSLKKTLRKMAVAFGQSGNVSGVVLRGAAYSDAETWLNNKLKENKALDRKPYNLTDHNCMTFVADLVDSLNLGAPSRPYFAVIPKDYMEDFQAVKPDLNYVYSTDALEIKD
ncbi:hypothetical protein CQ009_01505 [Pseudomonas sp. MYb2]|jgi:hypothetical protein|uniref:hypothetical protein n=1 Tax=Pseudomonas TaxID=286 RepID=UPI000CFE9AAD|nr:MULTISPECIES: hypothetical protein [Pseudomonas]MCP1485395.1 hypothetical protein [Pseudomonas fluorescens]PRB54261.1 hypothetical protein CQ025_04210 [Pseudomonas sp. MYb3]PRC37458.1 hypothetical protein CQ009_01505 [Pseudomonas sp. MYb2]